MQLSSFIDLSLAKAGIERAELARRLERAGAPHSPQVISHWLTGKRLPRPRDCPSLQAALELDADGRERFWQAYTATDLAREAAKRAAAPIKGQHDAGPLDPAVSERPRAGAELDHDQLAHPG